VQGVVGEEEGVLLYESILSAQLSLLPASTTSPNSRVFTDCYRRARGIPGRVYQI